MIQYQVGAMHPSIWPPGTYYEPYKETEKEGISELRTFQYIWEYEVPRMNTEKILG